MGKRGPKPQPSAIAKSKGYYRPHKHDTDMIANNEALGFVHDVILDPPPHLPEDAAKIWTAQLSEASKVFGYISFIDLKLFEEYCNSYATMMELRNSPKVTVNDKGNMSIHPEYKIFINARDTWIKLSAEFGFSPSARTRVTLQQRQEQEKLDEFDEGI